MARGVSHRRLYQFLYIFCFGLGMVFGITCADVYVEDSRNTRSRYLVLACIINWLLLALDRLAACFPQTSFFLVPAVAVLRMFTVALTVVPLGTSSNQNRLFFAFGGLAVCFQILTTVSSLLLYVMVEKMEKQTESAEEVRRSNNDNFTLSSTFNDVNGLFSLSGLQVSLNVPDCVDLDDSVLATLPAYLEVIALSYYANQFYPPPEYSEVLNTQHEDQVPHLPEYSDIFRTQCSHRRNFLQHSSGVSTAQIERETNPPPEYSDFAVP